jgi:hypothetical protein
MAFNEAMVAGTELERVLPKVTVVFEREDKFYANIKKRNVEQISNRQMRVPLELRPGGRFQYFDPDGGDLGRGSGPTFDKAVLNSVFLSENIEYTKLAQWATDDARKAVINGVRRITASALDEMRRQLDAQMMGSGNGVVGTLSAVSTASGVDTYTLGTDGFGARLVRYDQVVQLFDSTLATNRGSGVITMWDVENKQISVTPAISGATTGDLLVVNGIAAPASLPGLFGIQYHHSNASTGTWLGFSRSTTPEIRANRVNANSSPLSLPFPRLAINKIGNRVGEDNKFNPVAWMHPCQQQAYEEIGQLVSIIQKQPSEQALDMYFGNNMQMAGAPVRRHFNWNQKRIDFVVDSVWGRGEILPIGFYTTDGRRIFEIRGASGGVATADIFYIAVGFQTFVNNPAACSYIDTLAIPSGY